MHSVPKYIYSKPPTYNTSPNVRCKLIEGLVINLPRYDEVFASLTVEFIQLEFLFLQGLGLRLFAWFDI